MKKNNTQRIVIIGGPSTGKTSVINELQKRDCICFEEVSRQVTIEARKQGIDQLFLSQPLLFSEKLLEARKQQFIQADKHQGKSVFFDRGLPDVPAYMNYVKKPYPEYFTQVCENYKYDKTFILKPWKAIHKTDSERYESFEQLLQIHKHLTETYQLFGYSLIEVPFDTVTARTDFIINHL